jgi:hypothetical protein
VGLPSVGGSFAGPTSLVLAGRLGLRRPGAGVSHEELGGWSVRVLDDKSQLASSRADEPSECRHKEVASTLQTRHLGLVHPEGVGNRSLRQRAGLTESLHGDGTVNRRCGRAYRANELGPCDHDRPSAPHVVIPFASGRVACLDLEARQP